MQKLQEQIPVKTKSCAIIAVIHELSGLDQTLFHLRVTSPLPPERLYLVRRVI